MNVIYSVQSLLHPHCRVWRWAGHVIPRLVCLSSQMLPTRLTIVHMFAKLLNDCNAHYAFAVTAWTDTTWTMSEFDDAALDDIALWNAVEAAENEEALDSSPRPTKRRRLTPESAPRQLTTSNAFSNANSHSIRASNGSNASHMRYGPSEDQLGAWDLNAIEEQAVSPLRTGGVSATGVASDDEFGDEFDDIPTELLATPPPAPAPETRTIGYQSSSHVGRVRAPTTGLRQTTLFSREGLPDAPPQNGTNLRRNWPAANKEEPPTHHALNLDAAGTWVYPTNLGKTRDYQFNIVSRGLFHNTLVALPTGLM